MLRTLRIGIETYIDEYLEMAPDVFHIEGKFSGSTLGDVPQGRKRSSYSKRQSRGWSKSV